MSHTTEWIAAVCFALAFVHTFSVRWLHHLAARYPRGSSAENFLHLLGEVEVIFGIWAGVFLLFLMGDIGTSGAIQYLESRNFTEPVFVFVVMTICSTRPILRIAKVLISLVARALPLERPVAFYISALIVGPLLGSAITEPAAMTVTALILLARYYAHPTSPGFKYATLALLFVNVSIGGTLTPYAAPPVLMVAAKWNWDLAHMFTNFGWKAIIAIVVSTLLVAHRYRRELAAIPFPKTLAAHSRPIPSWVSLLHLVVLVLVILSAHYMVVFTGFFLLFLGLVRVTREHQIELKLREGLLVGFFLAGLVVLGGPQRWWLEPILTRLDSFPLYLGTMALTAITDNAALTYLGSQVPSLSEFSRYALVAGSVVGGGLTVIANAPNPAGFGILNPAFDTDGISPVLLFRYALVPTLIAAIAFWFF